MSLSSPQYWRESQDWSHWLGRRGQVIGATTVQVTSTELTAYLPYSLVRVQLEAGTTYECMGVAGEVLQVGDEVQLVLRRSGEVDSHGVIPYGIKAQKV